MCASTPFSVRYLKPAFPGFGDVHFLLFVFRLLFHALIYDCNIPQFNNGHSKYIFFVLKYEYICLYIYLHIYMRVACNIAVSEAAPVKHFRPETN